MFASYPLFKRSITPFHAMENMWVVPVDLTDQEVPVP